MATRLAGILNLTPDSFSDGGRFADIATVLEAAGAMLEAGAAILDIGAESTRPNAILLTPEEEWQRLSPVLPELRRAFPNALLSVDTRHAATAERALQAGVDWINDVSGTQDAAMVELLKAYPQARLVVMHSLSIPADPKEVLPESVDPVAAITDWMAERRTRLCAQGLQESQLIFDPGIGFGKSAAQSWKLIKNIKIIKQSIDNIELFVGHSRKSFLASITDRPAAERDAETHALGVWLALQGVDYLRVHDVAGAARALRVVAALTEVDGGIA